MTLSSAILGFAGIAFIITIIPATDTALVLRSLTTYGKRAAYGCFLGITAGLLLWGIAAATGLALLIEAAPGLFDAITIAGGIYLIYLGINLLNNMRQWSRSNTPPNSETVTASHHSQAAGPAVSAQALSPTYSTPKSLFSI